MTFYMWFSTHFLSQPVHFLSAEIRSLSAQSSIIFAPKPRIYYQNICILPRKIPINTQSVYFRTWNSLTFHRFLIVRHFICFSPNQPWPFFFWKYRLSIIFSLITS